MQSVCARCLEIVVRVASYANAKCLGATQHASVLATEGVRQSWFSAIEWCIADMVLTSVQFGKQLQLQ